MRLVCPSCEAKYEVPDDAIPDTGRDVQCANCGHAWYQMRQRPTVPEPALILPTEAVAPVEAEAAPAPDEAEVPVSIPDEAPSPQGATVPPGTLAGLASVEDVAPEVAKPDTTPVEPLAADLVETPVAEAFSDLPVAAEPEVTAPTDLPTEAEAEVEVEVEAEAAKGPAAYAVDESVLAILREEAQREAQARRTDSPALETQPELGVEAARAPARKSVEAAIDEEALSKPSARRDLLPDVEEINSTLRPSELPEADVAAAAEVDAPRSSFRSGFLLVMTVTMLGAALYVAAPMLGSIVPALKGPLESYVEMVNGLRLHLDGLMRMATAAINGDAG
jgi:resuscitation-promoting factor RpfA